MSAKLVWHECGDMRTAKLIKQEYHTPGYGGTGLGGPTHYGGRQEVNIITDFNVKMNYAKSSSYNTIKMIYAEKLKDVSD